MIMIPKTAVYDPNNEYSVRIVTVTYREDDDGAWSARIYKPEGEGPFPLLLDVHGGAWGAGGCSDNENLDRALAQSGLVVVAVELRKAPAHTYPSQVMDVNYAVRWTKTHAKKFNAVSGGMGGLGTSSGGHTLFLTAMRPDDSRYRALNPPEGDGMDTHLSYIIGAWPVIDPYARYLYAKENNLGFLVDATDAYFLNTDAMKEGNPLLALERNEALDLPPALIVQGTGDTNLPLSTIDRFTELYRKNGGMIELEWFQDMPHNFALKTGAETDRTLDIMKAFISSQLQSITKTS